MIRAVLIDIDDTLLDFTRSAKHALATAVKETGYVLPEWTFSVFWKINNVLWEEVEEGILTKERLKAVRWNTIFSALDLAHLDGQAFEEVFFRDLTENAFPVEGAKELLSYLSGKYRVYAASNASHNQQRTRLEKAGLVSYFTDLFVSGALGANKPTKEYFDLCFSRMKPSPSGERILPEETVLIGDSVTADIAGGNRYGLTTIWYNHNKKPDPTEPEKMPVHKVSSLRDIITLL